MTEQVLVDWAPALRMAGLALVLALLPLSWVWLRRQPAQGAGAVSPLAGRLALLTALTLFLTFDLIAFGAFTRLSDSGLGCPDWPGCYGQVSPLGAHADIHAAQSLAPGGPVTFTKAWIEMIHRYLAMTVGVLILVMTLVAWRARKQLPVSPWWPAATLVWVLIQGLFGKYTVTLKLYPAVVTAHLLGGLVLLVLLAVQHTAFDRARAPGAVKALRLDCGTKRLAWLAAVVLALQITLGGWVSTNYAVLACTGFPACNGQWWPAMNFSDGFTLLRGLGEGVQGRGLTLPALVAIHMAHRLFAIVATVVLAVLAWMLWRDGRGAAGPGATHHVSGRRVYGLVLAALLLAQLCSGLSNVVLGWPLLAALGHSAGAAGLVLCLTLLLCRAARQRSEAAGTVLADPGAGTRPASSATT